MTCQMQYHGPTAAICIAETDVHLHGMSAYKSSGPSHQHIGLLAPQPSFISPSTPFPSSPASQSHKPFLTKRTSVPRPTVSSASCLLASHAELVQCEERDTLYEYLVRADGTGWQHWREQIPAWIYPKQDENPKFSQLIIPTMDSARYQKLFSLLHAVNKVLLLA